ncbi:MAG: hypothetical protein MI919_32835, partial [Holophagales bacterium]|nr:hypothetical protein [Holophagales bacterium]
MALAVACLAATLAAASEPIFGPAGEGEAGAVGLPPLPEDVLPLAADRLQEVQELLRSAEQLRGLEAGSPLPVGRQGPAALARRIDRLMAEEYPAVRTAATSRALELFGWVPEGFDLAPTLRAVLAEQVAGYFDTDTGYLVIVDPSVEGTGDPGEHALEEAEPPAGPALMEDAVLVHEIVHFLQHLHFDLERFELEEEVFSDRETAGLALVEGDATHLMFSSLMGRPVEELPGFVDQVVASLADPEALQNAAAGMPGQEALAAAPAFLRDHLIFPYMHGLVFVSRVREKGGQELLDAAFRHDPPTSTEQILHPEKWLGPRDAPVEIELPDLSGLLGPPRLRGTWGEYGLGVGLRERAAAGAEEL